MLSAQWEIERLTDLDECWYEARSVAYAWQRAQAAHGDARTPVGAVLGVGGGSMQLSTSFQRGPDAGSMLPWIQQRKTTPGIDLPWSHAAPEPEEPASQPISRLPSSLTPCVLDLGSVQGMESLLHAIRNDADSPEERRRAWDDACARWRDHCTETVRAWIDEQGIKEHCAYKNWTGPLIMISGTFYAGSAAGITKRDDLTADIVLNAFSDSVEKIGAACP